jgi:endopeptidase La
MRIRDLKIYILKNEYDKYIKIIHHFREHIHKLYYYHVINTYEKSVYLNELTDIHKLLNDNYNDKIINFCEVNNDITHDILKMELNEIVMYANKVRLVPEIINSHEIYYDSFWHPLSEIKFNIKKIATNIGFPNIKIAIQIMMKDDYDTKILDNKSRILIDNYNYLFIPMRYHEYEPRVPGELEQVSTAIVSYNDKKANNFDLYTSNIYFKEGIIENIFIPTFELYLKNESNYLVLKGIFIVDEISLFMRSSIIVFNQLFVKRKYMETLIEGELAKNMMRGLSLGEIIVFSPEKLKELISGNINKYNIIKIKNPQTIFKESVNKNNIGEFYNTIKILLAGEEENYQLAGFLCSLAKDKKYNDISLSEVIISYLSYISQCKVRKFMVMIKDVSNDDNDYRKQILIHQTMPDKVKLLAMEKVSEMKNNNNDYHKQLLFVKTLIKFPWVSQEETDFFKKKIQDKSPIVLFDEIEEKLNKKVYGHEKAKEQFVLQIARWITNPAGQGYSIGLVGPPGVGKTLLAKSVSAALDLPFVQITLGGQNDGELLHGHGYTYAGAQPGMVIRKLAEIGKGRCIIYFDELDKCSAKHGINEISSIIIHLTDPNMNHSFQDRFFQGVDFPLQNCIFIASYNDSSLIDPILLDRFVEINVKPYTIKDKLNIVKDYVLPEIITEIGLKKTIKMSDEVIKKGILEYTNEAGVRDIKHKLELIMMKINKDVLTGKLNDSLLDIDWDGFKKYVDEKSYKTEKIHEEPKIGMINGLYATTSGRGGIVPIQVMQLYGEKTFQLKLTGSLGDVMKESIQCAYTAALSYIKDKGHDINKILENFTSGFHIHAPCGATPKDGPSAGAAFTLAFISILLNQKISNEIGITGEIELTGKITKIGGLISKLQGAKLAGIKKVLISEENTDDIEEIKTKYSEIVDNIEIIMVKNIIDCQIIFL